MAGSSNFDNIVEKLNRPQNPETPTKQGGYDDSLTERLNQIHGQDANYVPPVEAYTGAYANELPQGVVESQQPYAEVNIATPEYANEMQARIIADFNGYQTDDNYQGMLNRTYTEQTYDYLKRKNKGADSTAWTAPNPEDELFSDWLPRWTVQQDEERQIQEKLKQQTPTAEDQMVQSVQGNLTTQAQRELMNANNIEHGNWNLLNWWDKAKYLLIPGSSATTMDDAPDWAKYIQNIFPSVMAGGGGALVGSIFGPVGSAIGGIATGALTYLQGVTDVEIPVLNEALEAMDILSVWFEQGQGAVGAAYSQAKRQLGDDAGLLDLLHTTADVLKENPYLFEVGKYAYESSADLGFDDIALFIRNTGAKISDQLFGTNFGQRDISQISRANIGRSGLEEVYEGTQGYQALYDTYLPIFEGLVNAAQQNGLTEEQAIEFAHQNMEQYVINYMGSSGLTRDLVASSIADPANLLPYVSAKITEGVGKVTHNTALQNAGAAAVGNPIIDLLPPGVQTLAETALAPLDGRKIGNRTINVHGSQGFDAISSTYRENLRNSVDVSKMSSWQKRFAGIGSDGKLNEYNAFKPTGNPVVDYIRKLFTQTEDSKMLDLTQMSTDFLGNVMFNADVPLYNIPDLVEQVLGTKPIDDTSPLARFRNTATLNTLQEAFSNVDAGTINSIRQDVLNYRNYAESRSILDHVAQQLGMSVDDVFKALDNELTINKKDPKYQGMSKREKLRAWDADRQRLLKQITDAGITFDVTDANGKTTTLNTNQVIKKLDVFRTKDALGDKIDKHPGRKQYSETYLKANMMDTIATQIDNYNLSKFNITPDSWATRTSNLLKNMQSIALLNFSTSYQVNNFLNNIITRSVSGVGGISTDFINTVNAKRGLFFSRDSDTYNTTSEAIGKKKKVNGPLQKFDDMFNNVKDNKIMKGVTNLPIEDLEKNAAFNIGTNRYWAATWANNIPEMPAIWKSLGITDDMNQQIFKIALDSPNLEEFHKNLMGDVILPKAQSTLDQMLVNNYNDKSAKIIRDFISTKPWISDFVDSFMETGDPRLIKKGFEDLMQRLTNDVDLQNVNELAGAFEDYRNTFSGEGIGTAANALEALNDLYTQMWMKQTRENGNLFLDRVTKNIADPSFDEMYKAVTKLQTNDYKIARGYTIMAIGGMLAGLGIDSDASLSMLSNAMAFYDLGEEYVKLRHEMHERNARKNSKDYDYKKWHDESISLCTELLNKQLDASRAMHKTYVDYLRTNLDDSWTGRIDAFEKALDDVIKLKEADAKAEIEDLKRRLPQPNKRARETESLHQEKPRLNRKQQIHDAYQFAANRLKEMEGAMPANPTKTGTLSLEQTLRLELLHDEAKHMAEHSGEFMKKYKDGADPATVYEPVDFSNENVKTSFYEWGQQEIINDAIKNGTDAQADATAFQDRFNGGDAVMLGFADAVNAQNAGTSVYVPADKQFKKLLMTDHFELLNPNANVKDYSLAVARSQPFMWGDNVVNAGVFSDGQLKGYITAGMQQTVVVDGKTYPVVGISKKNPDTYLVLVGNKIREVTPGKPNGIEYTMFAKNNFHPQAPGSMPTIEATGKAAFENSIAMRDAIRRWQDQALSDLSKAQENGSLFGKMTDDQKLAVFEWMDSDLKQAYNAQRYQTQRYGETMVDAALLNYNKRYGFDNLLTAIMPYQFWMTRSIMNWGKRMISQPAWFSMYARLEKLIEKNKKDFLPSRLEGTVGLLAPNMGDGMGSAWFIDPFSTILPFKQFYNVADYYISNLNTIHKNTLTKIDEMYDNGEMFNGRPITDEMYNEARLGKGELYDAIFKQIQATDEADTSAGGLMGTFFGPPVWFDMARKHLEGKDKAISYSPMYRMGNLVKAIGDETPLESVTNVIGAGMQLPENTIRRMAGIESNPDGNYADYGIVSNIANLLTENKISYNDAINAIAEGAGNRIYDQALYQYRQQQAARMQGGALATEVSQSAFGNKSTSVGQIASSALASLFGAKVLPEGEQTYRQNQDLYRQITKTGDKELRKQFWKDHPDHQVHYYSYEDDPEKRLQRVLVDNMSTAYYALPYTQQQAVSQALGSKFRTLFLDKETRATDLLEPSEIIAWTRAMHGNVPELTNEQIAGPVPQIQELQWYADSVQADYDRYIRDRDRLFPGIKTVEEGYYNTPESLQEQYKQKNPMLQKYWDWNTKAKRANPRLAVYLNDRSAQYKVDKGQYADITQAIMGGINDWTKTQLQNHIKYGWAIKPDADKTLKTAYASLRTKVPYETWLKSLVK